VKRKTLTKCHDVITVVPTTCGPDWTRKARLTGKEEKKGKRRPDKGGQFCHSDRRGYSAHPWLCVKGWQPDGILSRQTTTGRASRGTERGPPAWY